MNWNHFWESKALQSNNPMEEVGRVSSQRSISENELDNLSEYITRILNLQPTDSLLDLCCGNGMITYRLAQKVHMACGIDFSNTQIKKARERYVLPNLSFISGDAMNCDSLFETSFNKVLLYFSFQYFDTFDKGKKVLEQIDHITSKHSMILLGDIPDRANFHVYYSGIWNQLKYFYRKSVGKENMGKFWKKKELDKICKEFNFEGKYLNQPVEFPYSHYRFDYLISKGK